MWNELKRLGLPTIYDYRGRDLATYSKTEVERAARGQHPDASVPQATIDLTPTEPIVSLTVNEFAEHVKLCGFAPGMAGIIEATFLLQELTALRTGKARQLEFSIGANNITQFRKVGK